MSKQQEFTAAGAGWPLSRRSFLKGVGTAGAGIAWAGTGIGLAGCLPATPSATTPLSVQLGWIKNIEFLGWYAAETQGYNKAEDLAVDLAGGGPSVATGQVVDARQKDVGIQFAALDLVAAVAQGAKLVTFGTFFQRSPAGLLYIKKEDGTPGTILDTVAKTKGKRIGLQTGAMLAWRVICQKAGLDMDKDMTIVPVSFDPTPLADGTVDGYWGFATSQPLVLQAQGYEVGLLDAYDSGYTIAGGFLTTHQDYIKNNRDTLVRFMRATVKGWVYANSHLEEMTKYTVDTYGKDLKLEYNEQLGEAKLQVPFLSSNFSKEKGLFQIDTKQWEDTVQMMVQQKQLEKPMDIKSFVNTDIIEEAYKGGKASLGQ